MKKVLVTLSLVAFLATSCGTKKKITELEGKNKEIQDLLNTATVKLNTCLSEKETLTGQIDFLKRNNTDLINNMGNMTTLSTKGLAPTALTKVGKLTCVLKLAVVSPKLGLL